MSETAQSESEYLAFFDKGTKWYYAGLYVGAYEAFRDVWVSTASTDFDPRVRARSLWGAGTAAYQLGDVRTALECYNSAISFIDGERLPPYLKVQALVNVSIAHYWSGAFEKAIEIADKGKRLLTKDVDPKLQADLDLTIGGATLGSGAGHETSWKANERALDTYVKIGLVDGQATALINLGSLCAGRDRGKAHAYMREALRLATRARIPDTLVSACIELGLLCARWKDPDRALRYGLAAVSVLWTNLAVLDKVELAKLSLLFGLIYRERGDSDRAVQQFQRAGYYFTETKRWKEWEEVTRCIDDVVADSHPSRRYEINPRAVERLRYFGALLEFIDSIETMYPYVRLRSQVVTHYALMMADWLGLSRRRRIVMSHAGRLHDVGMTAVDPEIVGQVGELTEARRRRLEAHVTVGENALRMFQLPEELYSAVRHHHEHYDGSGYPDGLRGDHIPLPAKILTLLDRYVELALHGTAWGDRDASEQMTARHEVAMNRLWQEAGSRVDPQLVALMDERHRSSINAADG